MKNAKQNVQKNVQDAKLRSKKKDEVKTIPYIPLTKVIDEGIMAPDRESCIVNGIDYGSFAAGMDWMCAYLMTLPQLDIVETEEIKKMNAEEVDPLDIIKTYEEFFGFADDDDDDCDGCDGRFCCDGCHDESDVERILKDLDNAIDGQCEYLTGSGEKVADILAEAAYAIRALSEH